MAAIARMDALIRNTPDTEAAVQLECALCPKRPTFSDSSHLLTHVSSKAHLHQKFSMEFKAKSDVAAREKLELYEKWYKRNEIERLLSERMSSKAKGRSLARRSRVPAAPRVSHFSFVLLYTCLVCLVDSRQLTMANRSPGHASQPVPSSQLGQMSMSLRVATHPQVSPN